MPTSHIVSAKQTIIDLCRSSEFQGRIRSLAANFFQPDEVEAVMVAALNANPKLLECDPNSIAVATLQCVRWRLLPDGVAGMAHLVPYYDKKKQIHICTLILGYRGLRELALRSPHVKTMFPPRTVYEADIFTYQYGTDENIVHIPCKHAAERGEIVAFYAVATMTSGEKMFVVMPKEDVDVVKANRKGPWEDFYEAMGQKTVVRRLCKALPISTELQQAVTIDEQGDAGIAQTFTVDPVAPPSTGKRTLDDVAGAQAAYEVAKLDPLSTPVLDDLIENGERATIEAPPDTSDQDEREAIEAEEAQDGPDATTTKVDAGTAKEIIDAFVRLPDGIKGQLRTAHKFKLSSEIRMWNAERAEALRSEIVAATDDGT